MLDAQINSLEDLRHGLDDIAAFLDQSPCQQLATLHANDFLAASLDSQRVLLNEAIEAPWLRLPPDWRVWIQQYETKAQDERVKFLQQIAGNDADNLLSGRPVSLKSFLNSCNSLQIDRRCPVSPFTHRKGQLGMNPKKDHEVGSLVNLIQQMWPHNGSRPKQAMDLGSGRAHLSRSLARPPLSMQVCAVDSSDTQLSGAAKLDEFYKRQKQEEVRLDHRMQRLESAQDITTLLDGWLADLRKSDPDHPAPPLVVALHACGDLSVSILRAFATRSQAAPQLSLVLVSCCYNMLSASSLHLSSLAHLTLTPAHLMLATQAPLSWETEGSLAFLPLRKLFYRSRLEAELDAFRSAHPGQDLQHVKRVGRLADSAFSSYVTFRSKALVKMGLPQLAEQSALPFSPQAGTNSSDTEDRLFFRFCCLWTLRALLGPVIESYILLDRHLYLNAHLQRQSDQQTTIQLQPVFDQASGSLRNMAFILRQP